MGDTASDSGNSSRSQASPPMFVRPLVNQAHATPPGFGNNVLCIILSKNYRIMYISKKNSSFFLTFQICYV